MVGSPCQGGFAYRDPVSGFACQILEASPLPRMR